MVTPITLTASQHDTVIEMAWAGDSDRQVGIAMITAARPSVISRSIRSSANPAHISSIPVVIRTSRPLSGLPHPTVTRTTAAAGSNRARAGGTTAQSSLSIPRPTRKVARPGAATHHRLAATTLEVDTIMAIPATIHSGGTSRPDIDKSCDGRWSAV